MATPVTSNPPVILPKEGTARVKSVLSGDTLILLGKATNPQRPPPEVLFTFEGLSAPRMMSKTNPVDEPGAFPAREWLRSLVVGKQVRFETRKQGASAGDRVYGWIFIDESGKDSIHLCLECVRQGHATPKALKFGDGDGDVAKKDDVADLVEEEDYERQLVKAYNEAKAAQRGIHAPVPPVRTVKNAGDDFALLSLVQACQKHASQGRITCVVEYVFDGSRFRCQVIDPELKEFQYAHFNLMLAGASCPRLGNPKAEPPTAPEPFAEEARQFVTARLLQRELKISLYGTDKSSSAAVGTIHHPAGNIAVELLKNGLARMTDWTVRMMPTADVPPYRMAENSSKRTLKGIWHSYSPPALSSASTLRGTVVEVVSGDTLLILPDGKDYTSEEVLQKVSLASIRAPRLGLANGSRADEPFAAECKERLRALTIGKPVSIDIHYEREIPLSLENKEKRAFATISVGKHADVSEVLISEGLATTQFHRDGEETSPRYDELRTAEAIAKDAKKGVHKAQDGKDKAPPRNPIDLTDPKKAKAYSGSLMRAGKTKAVVDFVFNGALFKLYVPAENCFIRFAPNYIRCPQPSPSPGSKQGKAAEPFGDEAKRHARLQLLQRNVEIECSGVTTSGIITGSLFVGQGATRRDYTIELLGGGLSKLDQRKVEFGEVPKHLLDCEQKARDGRIGLWSLEAEATSAAPIAANGKVEKIAETTTTIRLSEIRSGNHFFYHVVSNENIKAVEQNMQTFTQKNGTAGAPCDAKVGRYVAALFDDGSGKSWYRAKIIEKKTPGKATVLFIDHGNVATVPIATHLRPLDVTLGPDRFPAVAKEATLALTIVRSLDTDEGLDAARFLQSTCWGRDLKAVVLSVDPETGRQALTIEGNDGETVNANLIELGLARVAKPPVVDALASRMANPATITKLASDLNVSQETARRARVGMWRYGDVGDDDEE
ncbi:staphylococcal nuclease domain-containing protein 1 [Fistulifera solaris]|uniref:Staphylococcal nuclease domain-containing protein 1 n=1 Tax=Fistulifera solaris TaxID=1519565 RepID=A0A1Z5JH21_FISSO|nr:staphylococcal nuclease domain-containing protein 1 [Fistulifera solaris]|eukprot:GAX13294.1 staphylococcal nuclease domain-containing protein 1 [Fistulifera solaris]